MNKILMAMAIVVLSACAQPNAEPLNMVSKEDRAKARNHEYDGRYVGNGKTAAGYTCGAGYLPAQWNSILTINGDRFELTPWTMDGNAFKYHGNVSPGGVLSRYGVLVGRVTDGKFQGGLNMSQTCRHEYELTRTTSN